MSHFHLDPPVSPHGSRRAHSPAFGLRSRRFTSAGFTIVEALVALTVMAIFFLTSTMALNLFDTRAAQNRNTEAARALVDDYVNYLLDDNTAMPLVTAAGTDLDGDGAQDGVVCPKIGDVAGVGGRAISNPVSLVETRMTAPTAVVAGTLYWRVQAVGSGFGLAANTDLMQVNFLLTYVYRGQTYYYKSMTYKAKTS